MNNQKCIQCDNDAEMCFVGEKEGVEFNFYACKEHFLDMISNKVNDEGYAYKGTFSLEESEVPQVAPQAPQEVPQAVLQDVSQEDSQENLQAPQMPLQAPQEVPKLALPPSPEPLAEDVVGVDQRSGREISGRGKLRAMIDEAEAKAAGFTLETPLYSIGTKVVDIGIQNFKRSRQEFESKPKIVEACNSLIQQIEREKRRDAIVSLNEVCMLPDGRLTSIKNNQINKGSVVLSSPKTLGQLMSRSSLETTSTDYLKNCPTILRAHNVNYWLSKSDNKEVKFRLRKIVDGSEFLDDELYAVVGTTYSTFDVDRIAEIVKEVCSEDARAEIVYDGYKTRINVTFHSDIKPEECVTGELFKAGIIIKTSDTGEGSIHVSSFVERNLCLNLIVIDHAVQNVVRRRHKGDPDVIAEVVRTGIESAYGKIGGFVSKWGFANKENLRDSTVDLEHNNNSDSPKMNIASELFMAGLFNGMIDRELITVRGKKTEAITNLLSAWEKEPATTKAGAINAITRYAHESDQNSPWDEDTLQEQAGEILFSDKPLPWLMVRDE